MLLPIFHNEKKNNYTTIDNRVLNNENLSWKAKGILCYLLSLPEDWDVHWTEIATHATDGKTSLRSGVDELKEAGFIRHEKRKDEEGKFKHNYYVYEYPSNNPDTDYPDTENPHVDNPDVENPQLLSTNEVNTDELKTDKKTSKVPYKKIKKLYNDICTSLPSIRKMSEQRKKHVGARWKEEEDIEVFEEVFEKAENSSFLTGSNNRNWTADFDWIVKNDTNFNKILEGKYDDKKKNTNLPESTVNKEELEELYG